MKWILITVLALCLVYGYKQSSLKDEKIVTLTNDLDSLKKELKALPADEGDLSEVVYLSTHFDNQPLQWVEVNDTVEWKYCSECGRVTGSKHIPQ